MHIKYQKGGSGFSVYYDGEQAQSLPWIESKESWIFLRHILVEFVQDTK